jgi:2-dehydropantoate 2-reductase
VSGARAAPSVLRIAVAGAGAVGSVFGGKLAAAGHEVLLVGRDPHMATVARDGLQITGIFGETLVCPRVATDLAVAGTTPACDVVLVSVKSHATAAVAAAVAAWPDPPPLVVSLQNGLGNVEVLASSLGARRVLGARVIFGAIVRAPGHVHVTVNAKPVAIGPLGRDEALRDRAVALAATIAAAGIPCEAVDATEPLLWEKVLYNCGLNPLGALHGLTYGEVVASRALRRDLEGAIREGFAVAQAAGIGLPWADGEAFLAHFYTVLVPPTADHRSSMRQDLEAGRRTEVDAIGGAIVRSGERLGVATPVNARLVAAVKSAAQRHPRRSMSAKTE